MTLNPTSWTFVFSRREKANCVLQFAFTLLEKLILLIICFREEVTTVEYSVIAGGMDLTVDPPTDQSIDSAMGANGPCGCQSLEHQTLLLTGDRTTLISRQTNLTATIKNAYLKLNSG